MANNFSPEAPPELTTKPAKRPTISDIARAAGVSIAIVSYALNGKPGVSPATRDRVLRIADEYGWRPSAAARSLRTSSKTVGLAVIEGDSSSTNSSHFVEFLAGIQSALAGDGLSLMVHLVDSAEQAAQSFTNWWAERRFDGFLITDVRTNDPRIAAVNRFRIPAVALCHPDAARGNPCVWVDEEDAYGQCLTTLIELGHTHIAIINGTESLDIGKRRARAARIEAARAGIRLTVMSANSAELSAAHSRLLLSAPDRPTAIIYDSDAHAVTAIDVARRLQLRVPWDVSLIGFGSSASSQLSMPSLTSVSYPHREIGESAGRALVEAVAGQPVALERIDLGAPTVRGSTAPAPGR